MRRQTRVVSLSLQAHLEINNVQVGVLRSHINVLLFLMRLTEGVEGGYIIGAVVGCGGSHLAVDAEVLVNFGN